MTHETDWTTFRRYKYPHIEVKEEPGLIEFRQISGANKVQVRVIRFAVFAVFAVILLMFLSGGRDSKDWGLIFFFFGGILMAAVMGIAPRFAKKWNVLEITPGIVRLDTGEQKFEIKTENIRSLEVRPAQYTHNIYIWDGPVAIYAFAMFTDADAIAIRNGIEAALHVMNPSTPAGGVQPGRPASRRSFAE
jgi:hypothetical protein